jgi:hypothetical protein
LANKDYCRLYFAQPLTATSFLAINFICSTRGTGLATSRLAMRILDHVARTKESDAIVCEAHNGRFSDRLFKRWGWERHLLSSRRKHWIKRFYGDWSKVESLAELTGRHAGGQPSPLSSANILGISDANSVSSQTSGQRIDTTH